MATLTIKIDIQKIVNHIKEKYVKEFGAMDDKAYFMAVFVEIALNELNQKTKQ
jgi:hypothetical protein